MTDKQQPPEIPERVWLSRHYPNLYRLEQSSTEDVEFVPRVHQTDDVRVEEIRERQMRRYRSSNPYATCERAVSEDIDYLLSLLPQLSSGEPPACLGCIASRAGVGRCLVHEPKTSTAPFKCPCCGGSMNPGTSTYLKCSNCSYMEGVSSTDRSERRCGECGHEERYLSRVQGQCIYVVRVDTFEQCNCKCVFPATGAAMPSLPFVCTDCGVQQHADGICGNCSSRSLRATGAGAILAEELPAAVQPLAPSVPEALSGEAAREHAHAIVGTVFENTAASYEALEATMIERITDYLTIHFPPTENTLPIEAAAKAIVKAWLWHTSEYDQEQAQGWIERCIASHYAAPTTAESSVQRARSIQFPFPCGCLERHSAKGITVEEFTCDTHLAIAALLTTRKEKEGD